jgi:hypothetical protein
MKILLFLNSQKFSDRLAILSYISTPLPASIAAVDDGTLHRIGKDDVANTNCMRQNSPQALPEVFA